MFKMFATMLDQSLDKVLEPIVGKSYGQVMGRIGLIVAMAALVFAGAWMVMVSGRNMPQPAYFILEQGKDPRPIPALSSPGLSVPKIQSWSARALRDIFHLEFGKLDQQLAASAVYFEPSAGSDFRASLEKTQMIERVRSERLFVLLTPLEAPQVVGRGFSQGREAIRVEVPVVITYVGGPELVHQYQIIELFVRVVPPTEAPEGLAIARLKAFPFSPRVQ